MKPKNNRKISKDFIKKLAEISAGYISPEQFDKLIELIEKEASAHFFNRTAESNFLRIILSMFDKISFLTDSVKYPHYIEILVTVSVNSNYLTDILVREPGYFYWITNPSNLNETLKEEEFSTSTKKLLSSFKSFNAKTNAIRTLKRKELLRIGLRDILGMSELKSTTEQLSILAKVISDQLFSICYKEILQKYEVDKIDRSYCILALGKLGGKELNYSSDIDLVIFYDEDSTINGKKEYIEILTEAVYLFIKSATSITGSGFIYRVDFRLRPDGRTSALCRSLSSYLAYYESRGEDWERQMLVKAGFISGDKNLYNRFINYLQPFVYPSSFSVSPLEQIKKLKINIEKGLKTDENIKLQSGGIRDIEFSVQTLQLLNGGKNKIIRTGNTLEAIELLTDSALLDDSENKTLKNAYIFYRKIEHYLQLMNDSQTHILPSDGDMLEKLSSYLGFDSTKIFKEEVNKKRKSVREIYNSIMGEKSKTKSKKTAVSTVQFENAKKAEADLQYLREGKGLLGHKEFDQQSIAAFQKIEPELISYLKNSLSPDLVLKNFVRVIRHLTFPSLWYSEFTDNKFFTAFLNLCQFSQKAIDLFAEDDDLREFFLTRKVFLKTEEKDLNEFSTKKILFTLAVQFNESLISFNECSGILSSFFKQKIKSLAENSIEKIIDASAYFVAGMGSFGSGEMTFSSDIDLVFIVKDINVSPDVQKIFQSFLSDLKNECKPFDVDCRLRPEGKSSLLVWELDSYKKYIYKRARIWEFQAFSKLNFVSGNKKLFDDLVKTIRERIKEEEPHKIRSEMKNMRNKLYPSDFSSLTKVFNIKRGKGGVLDIDFITQFLMLTNPDLFEKCSGKGIIKILDSLNKGEKEDKFILLKNNFIFLKTLELNNQNIFNNTTSSITYNDTNLKFLSHKMKAGSPSELQKKISVIAAENQSEFSNYIY